VCVDVGRWVVVTRGCLVYGYGLESGASGCDGRWVGDNFVGGKFRRGRG
jgi:hypothetical protein